MQRTMQKKKKHSITKGFSTLDDKRRTIEKTEHIIIRGNTGYDIMRPWIQVEYWLVPDTSGCAVCYELMRTM